MTADERDSGAGAKAPIRALERKKQLRPSLRELQRYTAACLKCQPEARQTHVRGCRVVDILLRK